MEAEEAAKVWGMADKIQSYGLISLNLYGASEKLETEKISAAKKT